MAYFKYRSTKHINVMQSSPGVPVWQRNYYEHIIRDDHEWNRIREYVVQNPAKWIEDENHPTNMVLKERRKIRTAFM